MLVTGRLRDVLAVALAFAVNGLVLGSWAASMPALRHRVGTDTQGIAVLLLTTGIVAVASMQVGGRLADSRGARPPVLASALVMAIGALVLWGASSFAWALAGSMVVGLGNGTMDVAMNALAVQVERARPKPIMSRMHACWSLGSFLGAALVAVVGRLVHGDPGAMVRGAMATSGALALVGLAALAAWAPTSRVVSRGVDGTPATVPPVAWLLAGMAVCFGLAEGTATDWSSIHVTDVLHVDPGTGALGLTFVSAFMVVIRMSGDHLVARFGHVRVVALGAGAAAAGYLVTVLAASLAPVLAGWSLVGLGVGMIAPQIYGSAGHLGGGRVLSVVVTFGYAAFLAGPGLIGWLVRQHGVQAAMVLPLVMACLLAVLVRWMPSVGPGKGRVRTG